MSSVTRIAFAAALFFLVTAGIAEAQGVRKFITPDGRTIYSDTPIPGAREVGEVAPPRQVDPEARGEADDTARRQAERAAEADRRLEDAAERRERIRAAEQRLEDARRALENGKEPLPGERKGTAGGASRLTNAYFQRQQENERAVVEAQKKLDELRSRPAAE